MFDSPDTHRALAQGSVRGYVRIPTPCVEVAVVGDADHSSLMHPARVYVKDIRDTTHEATMVYSQPAAIASDVFAVEPPRPTAPHNANGQKY